MVLLKSNRGSVLIVALMFAAILAISLTSYLKLSLTAGTLANRTFFLNAAQNLLDTGFERTLWSLNNSHLYGPTGNWTTYGGFTSVGTNEYRGTFPTSSTYYPLSAGAKGQVKVWTQAIPDSFSPSDPNKYTWHAVAQATITLGDGTALSKFAETYLQQRSWSDRGMVSRNGITFNGNNVEVDSWISRPTPSQDIPYTTSIKRSEATIASPGLISLGNGDVYGYATVGTDTITGGISVNSQGRLGDFGVGNGVIDENRVTFDFTASFPDVVLPANLGTTLLPITGGVTNLATGTYNVPSIDLNANGEAIVIGASSAANVTLVVTGNVKMTGQTKIIIHPGSKLKIYAGGDFNLGGQAEIQNGTASVPNNPDCFTLLGTRTDAQIAGGALLQNLDVGGGSFLSCVIFAPNAALKVHGNGETFGSLVANSVTYNGNGAFHQDESLRNNRISGLWGLLKWRELSTEAERATYAPQLAF